MVRFDPPPQEARTAWFVILEQARLARNHQGIAEAKQKLRHLGVRVQYAQGAKGKDGGKC